MIQLPSRTTRKNTNKNLPPHSQPSTLTTVYLTCVSMRNALFLLCTSPACPAPKTSCRPLPPPPWPLVWLWPWDEEGTRLLDDLREDEKCYGLRKGMEIFFNVAFSSEKFGFVFCVNLFPQNIFYKKRRKNISFLYYIQVCEEQTF